MLPRHALRQGLQRTPRGLSQASLSPSTSRRTTYTSRHASVLLLKSWLPATRLASSASSSPASAGPTASQEAQEAQSDASAPSGQQPLGEEGSPDDRFSTAASEELLQAPGSSPSQPIGKIERRLSITFTCTVPDCGHRSSHEFSRLAYERGIVLCQCPACLTRHLIGKHSGNRTVPLMLMSL